MEWMDGKHYANDCGQTAFALFMRRLADDHVRYPGGNLAAIIIIPILCGVFCAPFPSLQTHFRQAFHQIFHATRIVLHTDFRQIAAHITDEIQRRYAVEHLVFGGGELNREDGGGKGKGKNFRDGRTDRIWHNCNCEDKDC